MKISFDFDGVLSKKNTQEYVKTLIEEGHEIWILTTRYDRTAYWRNQNYFKDHGTKCYHEVINVALELNIPINKVLFTCFEWKADFLIKHKNKFNIELHIDDNYQERSCLNYVLKENKKAKGYLPAMILTTSGNYRNKIKKFLQNKYNENSQKP